jgi:drug/metabolite transporter (DMT)-like permease
MSTAGLTVAGPLALGAAASFAVANVAQMRASRRTDAAEGIDPRLLLRLLHDKLWLAGLAGSFVGYGLQAVALFLAPVVLVQPLIVTELLFALPLAAMLGGRRLGRREWSGAALVAAGITSFVLVAHPTGERTHIPAGTWLGMMLGVGVTVAVLVFVAETQLGRPMLRASLLAASASVCFGALAVLTKVVGHQFSSDGVRALLHFQPWLMAVVAITGLLLAQTAFRLAPLSVSLPLIDVGEPLIASLLAIYAFGERIGTGPGTVAGVAVSAGCVAAGVVLLDTSPLVRAAQHDIDQQHVSDTRSMQHHGPGVGPQRV